MRLEWYKKRMPGIIDCKEGCKWIINFEDVKFGLLRSPRPVQYKGYNTYSDLPYP